MFGQCRKSAAQGAVPGAEALWEHHFDRLSQQLGSVESEQPFGLGIHHADKSIPVDDQHGVRSCFYDRPETHLFGLGGRWVARFTFQLRQDCRQLGLRQLAAAGLRRPYGQVNQPLLVACRAVFGRECSYRIAHRSGRGLPNRKDDRFDSGTHRCASTTGRAIWVRTTTA